MDRWQTIRTAQHLARLGTISAAAEYLGVHRATVLRHIDDLEAELGVKLFQRHARGYVPTEAGDDLMRVATTTEDQFAQLFNRLKQQDEPLSGDFTITSLPALTPVLMPMLRVFQESHPEIQLKYLTSDKLFRLEFGEAHVAVRTGPKPDLPDNVVLPFVTHRLSLYAHADYLAKHGRPDNLDSLEGHRFVGFAELLPKIAIHRWILHHVRERDISFKSNEGQVIKESLLNAMGIGFLFQHEAERYGELVELFPTQSEWEVHHWLVTHGDLHRSAKVQAFLDVVRSFDEKDRSP